MTNTALTLFASCWSRLNVQIPGVGVLDISSMGDLEGDYSLVDKRFIERREASRILLVRGWTFRDEQGFRKHADVLRSYFTPVDPHASRISGLIERARKDCDVLVGVHVRQGDYQKWLDGRYYYETRDYAEVMRRAGTLWKGKRVRFLVCSNESQDERLFDGLDYIMGNGHQVEDMYAFAACDYLIGPPSTYTMWASFYGSVPLFVVEKPGVSLTIQGFKVQ
jgi:hypothetical protein